MVGPTFHDRAKTVLYVVAMAVASFIPSTNIDLQAEPAIWVTILREQSRHCSVKIMADVNSRCRIIEISG